MAFHYYGDGGFKGNYLKILDGIYYAAFKVGRESCSLQILLDNHIEKQLTMEIT